MRRHDIENWALGVIDRVKLKQPVEDSRVELKVKWPDDVKRAARRIAGHANAARGEPILWLIGVNERTKEIPGAAASEFSSWYNGVRAEFDELAPEPVSLNIPIDNVTVTALYFETDGAPFVIKNSEGGAVQREVPWREATGVKSATRSQLLRLLSPLQKLPVIDLVACLLTITSWRSQNGEEHLRWNANLALFLTQPTSQETVFPSHRCEISYSIPGQETGVASGSVKFYGCGAKNINSTESFISIRGSGLLEARTNDSFKMSGASEMVRVGSAFADGVGIKLTLYSVEAERVLTISLELPKPTAGDTGKRGWRKGWHQFMTHPMR